MSEISEIVARIDKLVEAIHVQAQAIQMLAAAIAPDDEEPETTAPDVERYLDGTPVDD